MMYEMIVRNILRKLGVGRCYSGYDYIVHATGLMFFDERFFSCITKILYATVAENCDTSSLCIEKSIRKVIQVIWEDSDNKELIERFFGSRYIHIKPSNKEFLGLLYDYAKSYNILEEIFHVDKIICPISEDICNVCANIVDTLRNCQ